MQLEQLEPQFLQRTDDMHFRNVETIQEADGIIFLCPKCMQSASMVRPGVHSVICWRPRVPQTTHPIPGRWEFSGTGYADLTLTAGSSSILLTGPGCAAHFFVQNGAIVMC